MPKKIYPVLIILISIFILAFPQAQAVLPTQVDYDGERISVCADGVSLGQLLSLVEKQTGVQFFLNSLAAETIVYANFKNDSLSDGIKRILSKSNHAILYDGSGRIRTVFVFERQQALSKSFNNQKEQFYAQKESESFSEQNPDQGPEGQRPPPWASQTLSPENSTAGDNRSPQNESQPQAPSMGSDAEDISPQAPSMGSDTEDNSPQAPSVGSNAEDISPQAPSMESDAEDSSPQAPSMESDTEDNSPQAPSMDSDAGAQS
jgi:hypothetical protein